MSKLHCFVPATEVLFSTCLNNLPIVKFCQLMTAVVFYTTGQVSHHDTTTTLGSFCTGFVFVTFISFLQEITLQQRLATVTLTVIPVL